MTSSLQQEIQISLQKLLTPAKQALKNYWFPFLIIQAIAFSIVILYYRSSPFQNFCEQISLYKQQGGFFFVVFTSMAANTILPEIVKQFTGKADPVSIKRFKDILFNMTFFMWIGIMMDVFYKIQNAVWGNETHIQIILIKMLVEMLLLAPLIANPFAVVYYMWRENKYNFLTTLKQWNWEIYRERVLPILCPNWLYWVPIALCIYSLPLGLQFIFWLWVNAAWSLLLIFMIYFVNQKPSIQRDALH